MSEGRGGSSGGVFVAGAINTDLVGAVNRAPDAGETVTGTSFSIFGGGKAANQAVAARRAGTRVSLAGAVGDDDFGRQRLADLKAEGIDTSSVALRDGVASGVALIVVEGSGENRITYVPGATTTIDATQLRDGVARCRPAVYLQPNEAPLEAARAGLEAAGEMGAIRLLNAAPDPAAAEPLLDHVDLLIVNQGEAASLAGQRGDPGDMARKLAERYSLEVIVTCGGNGVVAVLNGESVHVPAPVVEVIDTTGAGDAFCGALAARLAQGESVKTSLEWAVVAGALAVTVAGAQPSLPTAEAIQAMLDGKTAG